MSATTTDLWHMSDLELAEAIRSRHICSQEGRALSSPGEKP
jgi:hypothetical protein